MYDADGRCGMPHDPFAEADFAEFEEPPKARAKSRARAKANGQAHQTPPPSGAIIDPSAPYKVAKGYIDRDFTHNEKRTLHYHRGGFCGWSGSAYPEVTDTDIRAGLYRYLDKCVAPNKDGELRPVKPDQAMVGNVVDALRAAAHLLDGTSPPTWLEW